MEKLNLIYAKTYNFVYLRAKTILEKEEDIQQLMKDVYLNAMAQDISEAGLFEWLGKQVYTLGCGKFRKRKVREAELIELDKQMYCAQESVDRETTKEVIAEALEELPDMYLATLYACYYDHMKLKQISVLMGYSVGSIINRLNYVHKYLIRALENYKEENGIDVQFSVEMLCEALRDWSAHNQLSEKTAQNIYASICRELGTTAESGTMEAGIAGANCRINNAETGDVNAVCEELEAHSVKKTVDKKIVMVFVTIGILVLLSVGGILLLDNSGKKDDDKDKKPQIEQNAGSDSDVEGEVEIEDGVSNETDENEDTVTSEAEYILPNSDKEKLTKADLEGLTKEQLRLARNEIYARHGMIFGVDDLDNYFATKSWYKPTISFADFYDRVEMSIIEEQNVILIQQAERDYR